MFPFERKKDYSASIWFRNEALTLVTSAVSRMLLTEQSVH